MTTRSLTGRDRLAYLPYLIPGLLLTLLVIALTIVFLRLQGRELEER